MPPSNHPTLDVSGALRRGLGVTALACACLLAALSQPGLMQSSQAATLRASRGGSASARVLARRNTHARESHPPEALAPYEYAKNEVVVEYRRGTSSKAYTAAAGGASAGGPQVLASHTRLLRLKAGVSVPATLARLRRQRDVLRAIPNYIAHVSEAGSETPLAPLIPDDKGEGTVEGEWESLQWNFVGTYGVNAPQAWANLAADNAPGGHGVIVAVLDTGVAYADHPPFRRSPDFKKWQFVKGYDFIEHTPFPNDHNGHGTFVAGTIAETTNNHVGLTGLAYEAKIMPVRVLDANGEGEASTIAEGIRYAVRHGAQIINLSLEFSPEVDSSDVPELIDAIHYATSHDVLVVAAAGNEGSETIPLPARAKGVISVGASTEHGCLANYSNYGPGITLVAPGGGPDAELSGDANCRPDLPAGRDIFQETFTGASPSVFGFPPGYEGTSMATPHVSATAALIIASGVLGPHPSPAQLTARLVDTARKLGGPDDYSDYGAGLLDAATATAPGGPGAVTATARRAKRTHRA